MSLGMCRDKVEIFHDKVIDGSLPESEENIFKKFL